MFRLKREVLESWAAKHGKSYSDLRKELRAQGKISDNMFYRVVHGLRAPGWKTQAALMELTGLSREELFEISDSDV